MIHFNSLSSLPQSVHSLVLPFFKGKIDHDLIQQHSGLPAKVDFEANFKEVLVLYHPTESRKIFLLGLGEEGNPLLPQAFRSMAYHHNSKWEGKVHVELSHLPVETAYHAARGMTLAGYSPGLLKTVEGEKRNYGAEGTEINVIHPEDGLKQLMAEGKATAQTQSAMMRLVDLPANRKVPQDLAQYAQNSAAKNGFKARVMDEEELLEEGLHAVLAVGRGSEHESVMIFLEYNGIGQASPQPHLGLVGKGITFDTGGISIKGSANMHYMKSDMGGAAAVLGAVELAAKLKLPIHVVAAIPSAENSVDAKSIKPGDVIGSYSGKTIEVINTDAEGRLILADGLAWLNDKYAPEVLMDLATLTGDCVRTLGYEAAGLFPNNDQLAEDLQKVGMKIGERLWRFPMWEGYGKDVKSDIADVKNLGGRPMFGAIFAGKFLEQFISDHPCWAHIDMAGVAFGDSEFAKSKTATGYGIHLLVEYMKILAAGEESRE